MTREPDPESMSVDVAAGPPEAGEIVEPLVAAGGGRIRAVVLFGSQLVQAAPDRHSAWDLVVVVDAYRPFYRALVSAGHHRRPAWLLTALGHVLAPSITAFDPGGGRPLAKCAIVSSAAFRRALAPHSPDHFLKGRMVQQVALAWARSPGDAHWVRELLAGARQDVLTWAGPYLGDAFGPEELARRMLQVSYAGEIRPESAGRVDAVFEAQRGFLTRAYGDVLERAHAQGRVRRAEDERYAFVEPARGSARVRMATYFFWSKVRATLRWAKHIVTFNDWLTYIQRKAERRTGLEIAITPWERRLPLLLLWPKVFRVLSARRASDPPPVDDAA